jgi:hypothetical protein
MAKSESFSRFPLLLYFLPFLHLGACVTIWVGRIDSGWQKLIILDFPFSILLVALVFRDDKPLLYFGTLGTLWWYALSLMIRWLFRIADGRNGG